MLQFTSHRLIDVGERYILLSETFSALLGFSSLLGLLLISSWVKETRNKYLLIIISLTSFIFFHCLHLEILMEVIPSLGLSVTFVCLGREPLFHADWICMFWGKNRERELSLSSFFILRECLSHYRERNGSDVLVVVKIVCLPLRQMVKYHITSAKR